MLRGPEWSHRVPRNMAFVQRFRSFVASAIESPVVKRGRQIQASYDAAKTTLNNQRHWAPADMLSANAALDPAVRRTLRSRARHEWANNTYASGMVSTLTNYSVGRGPRLQVLTDDPVLNAMIEKRFQVWADEIHLGMKIRTMKSAEDVSGEVFAILETNDRLNDLIKLDIRLIEADQVASPFLTGTMDPNKLDGVEVDDRGTPVRYEVLRQHPGDRFRTNLESQKIDAKFVLHLFETLRPGQSRGIPKLTPALPLFAMLRRYTLAVLSAAEMAALFAGVIQTDSAADVEIADLAILDEVEIDRNTFTTMPKGWKMLQMKSEQPTTTYPEFKREVLNEIARAMDLPFNIAAGNSSDYNYASGRLDQQAFFKTLGVIRSRVEDLVLNPLLVAWMDEFRAVMKSVLPSNLQGRGIVLPHRWFFDGVEHADPVKEGKGQELRLANLTTSLAAEYAKNGQDWVEQLNQISDERNMMKELGLTMGMVNLGKEDEDDDESKGSSKLKSEDKE